MSLESVYETNRPLCIYHTYLCQETNNNHDNNTYHQWLLNDNEILVINLQFRNFFHECDVNGWVPLDAIEGSYPLRRHAIHSSEDFMATMIQSILSSTGAATDYIDFILPEISSLAFDLVNAPGNANVEVISISLVISRTYHSHDGQGIEIDSALAESMQDDIRFTPASKSCIDQLNRFKVEDKDDDLGSTKEECRICLEKHSVGEEVICLPCGHVFHADCVVTWLRTSHYCPLCRFQMVIDDN